MLLVSITNYAQNSRVIGYLPTYRFATSSQIDYCKLTHLSICFANPDNAGNIVMPAINSVVNDALSGNPNIKILISFAGGLLSTQQTNDWSDLIDIPANRPGFIANIVNYVIANNLDGVDIDLEWSHVTGGYSDFIVELNTALDVHDKMLTVAFPNQTLFSNVNVAALNAFDFINIMSYDATGPWNPSSPGQHSSYANASNGLDFWKNTVGVAGEKLNLGVPFYGYNFESSTTVNAVTYAQMVATNINNADLDNVGNAYYNGRPTIEAKVNLANNEVGGIMIWELGQDSFDQYSLLTTIHEKYTSLGTTTTSLCGNEITLPVENSVQGQDFFLIYPNPVSAYLSILNLKNEQHYVIYDFLGKKIQEGYVSNKKQINLSHLINNIYFLHFGNGTTIKFLKE